MSERKLVRLFVSYASKDSDVAGTLIDSLKDMTEPSGKYEYRYWQDVAILPGEKWKEKIHDALRECSMGLLLISPGFLSSKFIVEEELPAFLGKTAKPMVPVMLKQVSLDRHNLLGLKESQIFRLKTKKTGRFSSYAQCGSRQKSEFIYELFEKMEALLDKNLG